MVKVCKILLLWHYLIFFYWINILKFFIFALYILYVLNMHFKFYDNKMLFTI